MSMSIRSRVATSIATVAALGVLCAAGAAAFIYSGVYDVSASAKDGPLITWLLHTTYERSLKHHAGHDLAPADLMSLDNVRAGARLYDATCALCHGAPDRPLSAVGEGIQPAAPHLLGAHRGNVPQQTFWVIKHGVNMTAMPSFGKTQSDQTIWQLSAFLYDARGISKERYDALKSAQ
jgi:mono/diheme cytochrome c family protein